MTNFLEAHVPPLYLGMLLSLFTSLLLHFKHTTEMFMIGFLSNVGVIAL